MTACKTAVVVWPASLCMAPCQPQQIIPSRSITRCSALHHLDALQKDPEIILTTLSLPAKERKTSTSDTLAFTSTSSLKIVMYACMRSAQQS